MHILHLYVRFDNVQRCEDTVSVDLCYINSIDYIIIIIIIIIIILMLLFFIIIIMKRKMLMK